VSPNQLELVGVELSFTKHLHSIQRSVMDSHRPGDLRQPEFPSLVGLPKKESAFVGVEHG